MKNAFWAWVTILLMGMGTAATASWTVRVDHAESAQAVAARVKPTRGVRSFAPTLPAAEEELPSLPLPPKVRPAPRVKDTRDLSRASRRQA